MSSMVMSSSEDPQMKCPGCGRLIEWNAKSCPYCGHDLWHLQRAPSDIRAWSPLAIVGIVIAVIVLIVGLVLVANGIAMLGTSQKTTSLYTFTASYWDMNQLQAAILLMIVGVLLTVLSGVYLIVSTLVGKALRRRGL